MNMIKSRMDKKVAENKISAPNGTASRQTADVEGSETDDDNLTSENSRSKTAFDLLMDKDKSCDDERVSDAPSEKIHAIAAVSKGKQKQVKIKKDKKAKKGEQAENLEQILAELDIENSTLKSISDEAITTSHEQNEAIKTAAQKKKEKKERQKREAALIKEKIGQKVINVVDEGNMTQKRESNERDSAHDVEISGIHIKDNEVKTKREDKMAKKKGRKDKEDDREKEKKKGMSKVVVAAMQEKLKKLKEEEEKLRREEEETLKREEELEELRSEQIRLEAERKEKKKQKEAERKVRLKAEGKLLTKKQKEDRARAQAMIEALRAQGANVPSTTEKRAPRLGTRIKPSRKADQKDNVDTQNFKLDVDVDDVEKKEDSDSDNEEDHVKDEWDATSSEDENNEKESIVQAEAPCSITRTKETVQPDDIYIKGQSNCREAKNLRTEEKTVKASSEDFRSAIVCVLGHVDTGKTKILDKLRRTHVQDSEAGGITQQIGATNVPIDAIQEQTKTVKEGSEFVYKLPGLLIIDTPGHESFSNLRNRGSSLCDIAILVVDIMHGLEPQTIESINLLKKKKTPFIVALNKIDRLYDWQTMPRKDVQDVVKSQQSNTQLEFSQKTKETIVQFAEQGLNAALFYENTDPRSYVSLVPTSAITGEGMGNLLYLIVESCQSLLAKRLIYSEDLQATVLEVKATPGLGTTIDAILINGRLKEGDTMIVAGTDGPIVTQIRSLLMPQPMKELRVKNAYIEHKEIKAAQGVKIAAKDLEKAIAGINLLVAHTPEEIEACKEEVARELKYALSHIKLSERGVYVQASTLGSLEALLEFLRTSKIPYSGIRIGPVVKRDVMKASIMLEHEPQYATILAFDVKVERDAQELADLVGVKIFQADIIYHLFDKFTAYRDDLKKKKRDEFKSIAVFPCKLKILPQFIFNSRDPIVVGVIVESGLVRAGTPLCVPSQEFVDIGVVTSVESNHKEIESARKGQEVCIKIEPIPGDTPKMFGRHFDENDLLVSKISRQSIDACKDYFRDDLIKADWALMLELKKLFEIL